MSNRSRKRASSDRGAALITVLSMLAIMSALAIVVVDAANMSIRRTANLAGMEQTRWYLSGAEIFAASRLAELDRRSAAERVDQSVWQKRWFSFPLDDGALHIALLDGSNCFNLNSIVDQDEDSERHASARGMVQFARLMDILDVRSDRGGLAASLADWIDTDTRPIAGGAEDGPAQDGAGVYRTANTLVADVSELRRVKGFDAETIDRLAPHVCVRPTAAPNLINPNTILPEQAPMLSMAVADLSVQTARQIIADRPRGGWDDLDAFFRHPRLASLELTEATRAQFSMQSSYYVLLARVEREDGRETGAALLQAGRGGAPTVLRRVYGVGAAENPL